MGRATIHDTLQEVCLELPDGPWPLPSDNLEQEAPGAAVAGTMSQDVNEDAVSLYDPPLDAGMAPGSAHFHRSQKVGERTCPGPATSNIHNLSYAMI